MEHKGLVTEKRGPLALVTIDDPEAKNTMHVGMLRSLTDVLTELAQDDSVRVIIFTGTGKSFIAGANIDYMKQMTPQEAMTYAAETFSLYERMQNMRQVLIAAVNGFALGAGTEFALSCDIRIASGDARFGLPEVKLGIIPGGGGTQRLARLIGMGPAKELIFTGRIIRAQEAAQYGIVNRVVDADELLPEAEKLAAEICDASFSAVSYAKACINASISLPEVEGVRYERNVFGLCFATPDQKEGMQAFLEKRRPQFL